MTGGSDDGDLVVLVDVDDREEGVMDKVEAHLAPGQLHRAASLCLVDRSGQVLLQRRAHMKYHFAGRWANACCTHPRPGEDPGAALTRRVVEELGVSVPTMEPCGRFLYEAVDPATGLVERELDHVFAARFDGEVRPELAEVAAVRWMPVEGIGRDSRTLPAAPWLSEVVRHALTSSVWPGWVAGPG